MWKRLVASLAEVIFPPGIYCIACGSLIDRTRLYSLCDSCIEKFQWVERRICEKCGKLLEESYVHTLCYDCRRTNHSFDRGFTCTRYSLYERSLMMDFKYRGKSYIGRHMGDIMYDRICLETGIDPDFIVPVPVHSSRKKSRGYNQAEVLALRLGEKMGIPVERNLLKRNRKTGAMKGLSMEERQSNVEGAFSFFSEREPKIAGSRILLVDDIYTTGSTVDSCSQVLKEGGVQRIWVLTFAAGGNRPPKDAL